MGVEVISLAHHTITSRLQNQWLRAVERGRRTLPPRSSLPKVLPGTLTRRDRLCIFPKASRSTFPRTSPRARSSPDLKDFSFRRWSWPRSGCCPPSCQSQTVKSKHIGKLIDGVTASNCRLWITWIILIYYWFIFSLYTTLIINQLYIYMLIKMSAWLETVFNIMDN